MTIKEYCKQLPKMGINDLLTRIETDGLSKYKGVIVRCMDDMNKIIINHDAHFTNAVNV